ncbi:MAG: glutamyl-tRNA reductase [Actinomycetota bacterium]|nr:glutamyl-tRNA reductase [Actinomycetota bacterium]
MSLLVVGLHQRSVPLELLERVAVGEAELGKVLSALAEQPQVSEAVVLSTCMRTEVYAVVERFHPAVMEVREVLTSLSGLAPEDLSAYLYSYWDQAAVSHLFEVAAGLDSAVLGEGEVLSQVRGSWDRARTEGTVGTVLSPLFRQAIEVGKRARSETGIARGTTSISAAAVALAASRLGRLAGRVVAVVGAGEMGAGMAQALSGAGAEVLVANRTPQRAVELAAAVGGVPLPLGELPCVLPTVDVLLTSAQSASYLLDAEAVEGAMRDRAGRPLLVVDVALPRNVDPAVGAVPGVTLLDLADLRSFAEKGRAERRREAARVAEIVAEEAERHAQEAEERRVAPLVQALHASAERVRCGELEHYRSRLGDLDSRQAEAVDAMTKAIVAKLLHSPTVSLKAASGSAKGDRLAETLAELFGL